MTQDSANRKEEKHEVGKVEIEQTKASDEVKKKLLNERSIKRKKTEQLEEEEDRQREGKKGRIRERSDNLKLNSHHVSVQQNSIVFIGSP